MNKEIKYALQEKYIEGYEAGYAQALKDLEGKNEDPRP